MKQPILNLYNPGSLSAEQLLAEFIDRKNLLQRLLELVRQNTPDRPQQHVVLIGPRGMGKTTLLCAVAHSVCRDPELDAQWLPLLFQEEQYGIGDLADFWLNCIRQLQVALRQPSTHSEQLLDQNPDDLAEQAQQRFMELLHATGKRAILLIDNLNDVLNDIGNEHALHQLRALWMTDPNLMVIGAAPSYFDEITATDQAFHDFFRVFTLERLSQAELEDVLQRLADLLGDSELKQIMQRAPERVAAMRILTGGNPRLIKLGYQVLRDGLNNHVRDDLERLLDQCTPYFKHRIDSLPKEARRTFDAIAQRWDPISVDDIRRELRKPSNYVSAQIKRLIEEGFVEETSGDKKKRYQVSERFYNIYYLMRHSREGRRRLRWLVAFMQAFYQKQDFKNWAKTLEHQLAEPQSDYQRGDSLAYLHALSDAADNDSRRELFETLVRDAIARDDRQALDAEISDNPIEKHSWRYLLAEVVWLLPNSVRQTLSFKPSDTVWWRKLKQQLTAQTLMDKAEQRLRELGAWEPQTAAGYRAVGVVLDWLFSQPEQAEAAYRKAIKLDATYLHARNGLGNSLCNQQRYTEAETAYRKTIKLDATYAYAWNGLGISLINQQRYTEAETAFRKAIELDATYVYAWNNLGISLNDQQRYTEAEAAYREAIELDATYLNAWNNLGSILNDQQRYTEAEAAYRKAIELDATFVYAWCNLAGTHLFGLNQPDAAMQALLSGLALDHEYAYGLYVLSQCWQTALPQFAARITDNAAGAESLRAAMTQVLLQLAATGRNHQTAILEALTALSLEQRAPFEPLLVALQALQDREVLYRVAREKRELALDVMAQIAPDSVTPQ